MGLEFEYVSDPGSGNEVVATERLCLTDAGTLVPENHPKGRRLFCVPGDLIPRADAEKYGLLKGKPAAVDLKAVRAWAVENGVEVSKSGKIAQTVIDAYNEQHEG